MQGLRLIAASGFGWNISSGEPEDNNSLLFYLEGVLTTAFRGSDGSFWNVSDQNLKKNISTITNAGILEKVMQLSPVTYLMKEEPEDNKYSLGFISQEVEKIFPQVVSEVHGIKMMSYSGLIPVAVQAIKEQQVQIEVLKKQVLQLQSQLKENAGINQQVADLTSVVAEMRRKITELTDK